MSTIREKMKAVEMWLGQHPEVEPMSVSLMGSVCPMTKVHVHEPDFRRIYSGKVCKTEACGFDSELWSFSDNGVTIQTVVTKTVPPTERIVEPCPQP